MNLFENKINFLLKKKNTYLVLLFCERKKIFKNKISKNLALILVNTLFSNFKSTKDYRYLNLILKISDNYQINKKIFKNIKYEILNLKKSFK